MDKRILIAMSGGVDSAVAAYLIKSAGYECAGLTMLLNGESGQNIGDAKSVARAVGIEHYVVDLRKEFSETVISRFVSEYEAGRTPNPCVFCNKHIKFGLLMKVAADMGYDTLATGHYARIIADNGRYLLKKGADLSKDQSYFLSMLSQEQLSHTMFPLGGLIKSDIKKLASEQGFVSAARRESQDVCFVPDGDYDRVIRDFTGKQYEPGSFVTSDGRILGRHRGMICYTIGQRKGLGLALPEPMYVCEKRMSDNSVVLCTDDGLYSNRLEMKDLNMLTGFTVGSTVRANVRIRYRHTEQPASVTFTGDGIATVIFDTPQRAITPGQTAVIYDGDTVLGGGEII